ncbi:hypothetical protein, partial [Mycoplasmoides pneumoniae]
MSEKRRLSGCSISGGGASPTLPRFRMVRRSSVAPASLNAGKVTRSTVPSGLSQARTTSVGGGPFSLPEFSMTQLRKRLAT